MDQAKRLLTSIEIDEPGSTSSDAVRQMSISAILELGCRRRARGVHIEAGDLSALSHDVDISREIQERVGRAAR